MSYGLEIEPLGYGRRGLRLIGEVDIANRDELAGALAPLVQQGGEVLLDCSDLAFIDSTGIGVLIDACLSLTDSGRIVLMGTSPPILRALQLLGLQKLPHLELRPATTPEGSVPAGFGPGAAHRLDLATMTYESARARFRTARLTTAHLLRDSRAWRRERRALLEQRSH